MEENPSLMLLWLYQSTMFPVVADFSFLVGLNPQPYLTKPIFKGIPPYSLRWSVKKCFWFLYVIFGQKRTKLLGFLMKYDSCTVIGTIFIMLGVLAVNQSL